jgi:hypothetical protein
MLAKCANIWLSGQHVANMSATFPAKQRDKCKSSTITKTNIRQAHNKRTNVDATGVETTAVTVGNSPDNAAVDGNDAAINDTITAARNTIVEIADSADNPNVSGNATNITNTAVDVRAASNAAIDVANTAEDALTTDANAIDSANAASNSADDVANTAGARFHQ